MAAILRRHTRKIAAGGVIATAFVFADYLPNPFRTYGVENIEKRWSSGGGSASHTPGSATPRGKPDQQMGNVKKQKGIGTPHWDERLGDQKPGRDAKEGGSTFDNKWNEAQYKNKTGK